MLEQLTPWTPNTSVNESVNIDDLSISFQRTIRVPDNQNASALPPDMGNFPLFLTRDYAEKLPLKMAQKGGMFIPMYQNEAMWIYFESQKRYAIKIYVGSVNAISGEPAVPTAATSLRRRHLLQQGKTIQDYVVVPDQKWIDGVAVEPGKVRQFVALPFGTGGSIEAQMTGEETTAGIQFEITRLDTMFSGPRDNINVMVKALEGRTINFFLSKYSTVEELKELVQAKEGVPLDQQRLVWATQQLQDQKRLCEYNMQNGTLVHLVLRMRGGSQIVREPEMNLAAGGLITQNIVEIPKRDYRKTVPTVFNVQILNSASFQRVTGRAPPKSPITAATYVKAGYPFFSMYEGPTNVSGDFSALQSVAQLKIHSEQCLNGIPIIDVETGQVLVAWKCNACEWKNSAGLQRCENCLERRPTFTEMKQIGLLNPQGPKAPFKLTWEVAGELNQKQTLF